MKDIRDAFILWVISNTSAIIGAAFHSFAASAPVPLMVAMYGTALTFYIASTALIAAGTISLLAGWKKLKGNDNA